MLGYVANNKVKSDGHVVAVSPVAVPQFPDAKETDPTRLGLMTGFPPAADKLVTLNNYLQFPKSRWAFSHMHELLPSCTVSRGEGAVSVLPRAECQAIDNLTFMPLGSDCVMTWEQSLAANYTDGIVILHQGKLIYERYFGALKESGQHLAMSVTKSFTGLLAAILAEEGALDPEACVVDYVPELCGSAFGSASVRQVMDMTTGIRYSENYADPEAEVWEYTRAGHMIPRPEGYCGSKTLYQYLQKIKPEGEHGIAFAYKTVNTDVLGWIIRRVSGKTIQANLQERIWGKLGAEQDAYFMLDDVGTEFCGGGLNLGLRDMARFGEMMRLGGRYNNQQIVPSVVVADIQAGASQAAFAKSASYRSLRNWSYRNMWWVSHNAHGVFAARGIHGQTIYVDPKAEMVIARFASHHLAPSVDLDPTTLPAFEAVAHFLMQQVS